MSCKVDSWVVNGGEAWFRCPHGTVGCPRCHDGLTPHCIECADPDKTCRFGHKPPAVQMTVEEHCKLFPKQREVLTKDAA